MPLASIVIPTRARPGYLEVALASIAPQAAAAGAEVLVVDDSCPSATMRTLAELFDARYEPHPAPLGLNVARNTGVEHSTGEVVVFVDDDVEVAPGWLDALLRAAREHPEAQVFTGPIRARLEGRAPRGCGREAPPITTLDLGPRDTTAVRFAWGANMAVRRTALERVGPFDVTLEHGGDEQEWQERLDAAFGEGQLKRGAGGSGGGGRVLYVAAAALDHRRAGDDARLRSLARTAYARGRAARRFDVRRQRGGESPGGGGRGAQAPRGAEAGGAARSARAPSLPRELLTLAGCVGHVVRRRCLAGLTMVAHSGGRVREALRERWRPPQARTRDDSHLAKDGSNPAEDGRLPPEADFLSGASGAVGGADGVRRGVLDALADARELASGRRARLARAARREPPARRVLVLGVERPEHCALAAAAQAELRRSRHAVELHTCPPGAQGRFENLNALLARHPAAGHDWLVCIDDDVTLPRGFLDRALFLAERWALDLAQPAHRLRSHAAWQVTRRRAGVVARETRFVEIGPVTLFARSTFSTLLPFPPLRMGWGVDLHWAALARERGWRVGVLDAVAVAHMAAPAASAYPRAQAIAQARTFLAEHPYLSASEAQATLMTHRRW